MTGIAIAKDICLIVNRPEAAEVLFLTKNKYFDKHPSAAQLFKRTAGDSIIFAKSDVKWQQKRKALSAALYKDKLKLMIEIMKDVTIGEMREFWSNGEPIDIVKAASNLFIKITLACLFGEGYVDAKVKQKICGKEKRMPLGECILSQIEKSMSREF